MLCRRIRTQISLLIICGNRLNNYNKVNCLAVLYSVARCLDFHTSPIVTGVMAAFVYYVSNSSNTVRSDLTCYLLEVVKLSYSIATHCAT